MSAIERDYAACTALLREADKDRFLASLFAPQKQRRWLHALYAFDIELLRIAARVREPMAGEIRLQWWRDVLAGERACEAAAHPIAAALVDALGETGLARTTLEALIDARARDLYHDPMMDQGEFEAYAWETDGVMLRLAAALLTGAQDAHFAEVAQSGAMVLTIGWTLRQFPAHAARRQTYIPDDLLRRHGVEREDIFAGNVTPAIQATLAEMRADARKRFVAFRTAYAALPAQARPALLHVWLMPALLDRMEKRDFDPFRTPVEVPQWRRQWRLWRASRS